MFVVVRAETSLLARTGPKTDGGYTQRCENPASAACCHKGLFRLIPAWFGVSLESLENAVFPFASGNGHHTSTLSMAVHHPKGLSVVHDCLFL
jgi:hypothetical protein